MIVEIRGRDEDTHQPSAIDVTNHRLKVDTGSIWTIRYVDDEAPNDSNKVIAVPANMIWHLLAARVELATDANAGNRQLELRILDNAADIQWSVVPDLTQAASLTYNYNFGPSMADLNAVRDTTWVSTPIPPTLILPAGSQVNILDNNAVSIAGDDMVVHLTVAQRNA